jgi:hypothetical protein
MRLVILAIVLVIEIGIGGGLVDFKADLTYFESRFHYGFAFF